VLPTQVRVLSPWPCPPTVRHIPWAPAAQAPAWDREPQGSNSTDAESVWSHRPHHDSCNRVEAAGLSLGWESGGSPQNLQQPPKTPNQRNRKTPSQLDFANIPNVPGSPLTGHSKVSGLQAGSSP